jgi:hypothetical protein
VPLGDAVCLAQLLPREEGENELVEEPSIHKWKMNEWEMWDKFEGKICIPSLDVNFAGQ